MATITLVTTGLASVAANWTPAQVPVAGDKVVVPAGLTVEVDGTYEWGDDTTTTTHPNGAVNIAGSLKFSRSVNSSLTGKGIINIKGGGALDMGTVASPIPSGVSAELVLNKRTTQTSGTGLNQIQSAGGDESVNWSFIGASRTRNAVLASDFVAGTSTCVLDSSSHTWEVGDSIVFMNTTDNSAQDQVETRVVQSIAGANITLTAAATYTHKAGSPASNASSNVVVRSFSETSTQSANINFTAAGAPTAGVSLTIKNALFKGLGQGGVNTGFVISGNAFSPAIFAPVIDDCAFVNEGSGQSAGMYLWNSIQRGFEFNRNFVMAGAGFSGSAAIHKNSVFCVRRTPADVTTPGRLEDCFVCFRDYNGTFSQQNFTYLRTTFCGRATAVGTPAWRAARFVDCDLGKTYGWKALFGDNLFRLGAQYNNPQLSIENCKLNSVLLTLGNMTATGLLGEADGFECVYRDKDQDVTLQERYTNRATFKRDNAVFNRSTSSIAIKPLTTGFDNVSTASIPCAAGATIRIVGYVRADSAFYNGGDWFAPTVTISGLGITPVTFTASALANGAWEKYDISAVNTVSGVDGKFTLTYTAKAKSVVTGTTYFDGVPDAAYITKARHYGFIFDESSPVRTVNPAVSASEAVAAAYTGATINTGTPQITVGAGTIGTWKKLYDYTQAWACLNLAQPVLLTSADAQTFALPVACKLSWPGMGDDGALSGGTLLLAAPGVHSYKLSGTRVEFGAAGSYNMAASSLSGSVQLVNTSGGAVTVSVPSGASVVNVGPNIAVVAPTANQRVTVNGLTTGSRVQVYDMTSSTELLNTVATSSSVVWEDTAAPVASRAIRVRVAYASGVDAKQFVDASVGTCGTTLETAAASYLVSQQTDAVYVANAIDGSLVTGITIVDSVDRMQINIAGGAVSWRSIYAYNVYWLTTIDGIRDDGSIITAKDTANYTLTLFKIKNTSSVPLKITDGYGVDSVTGSVADILDVSGGSIFPVVDHVVSSIVTVSGASVVTGTAADIIAAMPTAVANASAVRTELGTELARLDVAVSTRNATAPPTAATVAAAVLAAATEAPIAANIEAINGTGITGGGVPGNEWGPA